MASKRSDPQDLQLQAPYYPALVHNGREQLKCELLSRWNLPFYEFPIFHNQPDIYQSYPFHNPHDCDQFILFPCKNCRFKLITFIQIWLASDDDLYFLFHAAPLSSIPVYYSPAIPESTTRYCPSAFCSSSPEISNAHGKSEGNGDFTFPVTPDSTRRTAILEAKLMLQREQFSQSSFGSVISKFQHLIVSQWILALNHELENLLRIYFLLPYPYLNLIPGADDRPLIPHPFLSVSLHPAIQISQSELGGSGVFTESVIISDSILMSVSDSDSINIYTALLDPKFSSVAQRLLSHNTSFPFYIDTDIILMLYLIYDHFVLQNISTHSSYYLNLPYIHDESNFNLLLAPPEVVEFIGVREVEIEVESLTLRLFETFQWLKQTIFKEMPFIFDASVFTWDKFLWSRWLIDTRGFALEVNPPSEYCNIVEETKDSMNSREAGTAEISKSKDEKDCNGSDSIEINVDNLKMLMNEKDITQDNYDSKRESIPYIKSLKGKGFSQDIQDDFRKDELWKIVMNQNCDKRSDGHDGILHIPKRVTNLLPGIDMFNHHPLGHCRPPKYDSVKREFIIHTEVQTLPHNGERIELFMSYGPCENWQLMLHYGFCPPPMESVSDENDEEIQYSKQPQYPNLDIVTLDFEKESETLSEQQTLKLTTVMKDLGVSTTHLLRDPQITNSILPPQLLQYIELNIRAQNREPIDSMKHDDCNNIGILSYQQIILLLQNLLEPIIQKLILLESWSTDEITRPHWYCDWNKRLENFFKCRRNFLLPYIHMLSNKR